MSENYLEEKIEESRVSEDENKIEERGLGQRDLEFMRVCYEQGFLTKKQIRRWVLYRYGLKNMQTARSVALRGLDYLQGEKLIEDFLKNKADTRVSSHKDHFIIKERIACAK